MSEKEKKGTKKKDFSIRAIAQKVGVKAKLKPQEFLELGDVFLEVTGLPGPAIGHINMLIGHSDTGKTSALIMAMVDSQKKGRLPVILLTEQKWNFEHAKEMGLVCEQDTETGEWIGDFIFRNDFLYVEQITDYINELLDLQKKGDIPYGMDFFWDSVGSLPCKLTFEGKGGTMHTARVLSEKIGMGLNQRISGSLREGEPYTNSMVVINQVWVQIPDGPMGAPRIMPKGGTAFYYNSSLVFQFGNIANAGTNKIFANAGGRKILIGTRTKISVIKNHINGLSYQDSKVIAVADGFIHDDKDKASEKAYIAKNKEAWIARFGEFDVVDEFVKPSKEEVYLEED
jgi:hypothetical protein